MSCQHVPIGCSPYYVICGRPQTINEQSDFGDMVVKAAVQCCDTLQKQGTDVVLLNTAVDGALVNLTSVDVKYPVS
eukprot:scaffold88617_cov63-Attheya_sp.AAC.3